MLWTRIREEWGHSRLFRLLLGASAAYALVRVLIQVAVLVVMFSMGHNGLEISGWAVTADEGSMIPDDLRIYLDAAQRLGLRENLYIQGTVDRMEFFQYAPPFALFFTLFSGVPREIIAVLHTLLIFIAYGFLYFRWGRILRKYHIDQGVQMLVWTLPVWLLFSSFWTDLGYLNVYVLMALLATFAIEAVIDERLGMATLWLAIILQVKPQWAFALAVPLMLRRWRFFLKLVGLLVVSYALVTGITLVVVGGTYGIQQYVDYLELLRGISSGGYPWRDPSLPFLGYNHSIKQVIFYTFGVSRSAAIAATVVKVLILAPLGIVFIRHLLNPVNARGTELPLFALDLALVSYLAAFIWLDMVWELTLGIAVFTYLLATVDRKLTQRAVLIAFLPYALLDPFRIGGFLLSLLGVNTVAPGLYIRTDPAIYLPVIMIATITFYVILLARLWKQPSTRPGQLSKDAS